MDNSNNGQNKLIVLVAVALIGAAAGQHLLKPAAPPVQQMGPWGPGYAMQQPSTGYAPMGYGPQGFGNTAYGPVAPQYPQPEPTRSGREQAAYPLREDLALGAERDSSTSPRRRRSSPMTRLVSSDGSEFDEEAPLPMLDEPRQTQQRPVTEVAQRPIEAAATALTAAVFGDIVPGSGIPNCGIAFIEDQGVLWGDNTVLLSTSTVRFYLRVDGGSGNGLRVGLVPGMGTIQIVGGANLLGPVSGNLYGPVTIQVANTVNDLASFAIRLELQDPKGDDIHGNNSSTKVIRIPSAIGVPKATTVQTNRFDPPTPIAGSFSVQDRFLRINGTAKASFLDVVVCIQTATVTGMYEPLGTLPSRDVPKPPTDEWSVAPDLSPVPEGSAVRLLLRATDDQLRHVYAAAPTNFSLQSKATVSPGQLAITDVQQKNDGGAFVAAATPGRFNKLALKITADVPTNTTVPSGHAMLIANGVEIVSSRKVLDASSTVFAPDWTAPGDGRHNLEVVVIQGSSVVARSDTKTIQIRRTGPRPISIAPENLALTPGVNVVDVQFDTDNPITITGTLDPAQFRFPSPSLAVVTASLISGNKVRLDLGATVPPNAYKLTVSRTANPGAIVDLFGNALGSSPIETENKTSFEFGLINPIGAELSSTPTAGLKGITGPHVPYQEYTDPRKSQTGFNPSDKVVTRVARLYYYRDAHRVVQLINRGARSYNRQAVGMQQQLADNSRRDAENATAERQASERAAINSAQRARAAETALNQFQQALVQQRQQQQQADAAVRQQQASHRNLQNELSDKTARRQELFDPAKSEALQSTQYKEAKKDEVLFQRKLADSEQTTTQVLSDQTKAASQVTAAEQHVNAILSEVQSTRDTEARQRELTDQRQFDEDRKHKELFRREVSAAHEDPDTYAPGDPKSQDPIEQVSLSVIGEGLIQLRGPLKGVNLARTLINQIDAPVGQVKVAIHTVQVNGEHGKRMEPVIGRIQRYIDHSRFLTTQSGQMLRNAVTLVASRRADQAIALCEGASQEERDQKYIEAFFGREFLAELRTLDSEFLHTGNKLLSLHSMDSTSLANALFLLSLAKNDVRREILGEFERMVTCNLPQDEQEYFIASNEKYKFGPMFHKQKFQFLGHNAKFVSLKGFFNADVAGSDTLTPMQREFIRLAQIFKSRLVTEIELGQRVMERSLIEERLDDSVKERENAKRDEASALDALKEQRKQLQTHQGNVLAVGANIEGIADAVRVRADTTSQMSVEYRELARQVGGLAKPTKGMADEEVRLQVQSCRTNWIGKIDDDGDIWFDKATSSVIDGHLVKLVRLVENSDQEARKFKLTDLDSQALVQGGSDIRESIYNIRDILKNNKQTISKKDFQDELGQVEAGLASYISVGKHVADEATALRNQMREVVELLGRNPPEVRQAFRKWIVIKDSLQLFINDEVFTAAGKLKSEADAAFKGLMAAALEYNIKQQNADTSRRPLDHKKYMDMLIDDVEDKFIELMEGTRAHTANIDNYLSRLGQALEDDFNTQFYFPAFKGIREASRFWDVSMGQIETTTILTNNRMFAKVSPQATMEFDLPKRDILIKEAFQSAQAAYQDYGALLGDPTFLALTKMHRGQAAAAVFSGDGSTPTTRNVLPGLPSMTDEKMVAQNRAVAPDFPSALESLIPDPAIYKFETGTGYEIRPVIQPDGQAVVFHFNYMYTTNVREPVRADEKHLGRVKRHFIDTDVQTGNYEMREVSKYQVALKASRTSRGVPLLEDIPGAGILFRPLPNQESSIQENIILAQSVIFPTLFDLMGLRWAPAVADLDSLRLQEADFVTRSRQRGLKERVFDHSSQQVDEFLRIPQSERRADLYRSQETTPYVHPNGYSGPGLNLKDGHLQEGYDAERVRPETHYTPGASPEGAVPPRRMRGAGPREGVLQEDHAVPLQETELEEGPPIHLEPGHIVPGPGATRSRPTPSFSRVSNAAGNSPVQQQSYRTVSPATNPASGAKASPATSPPRGSRPVPKGAGSPPGLLPGVSPPPLRLPAPDEVKPSASATKGRSPQIVQVSGTESSKLEPAPVVPAKKKLAVPALWPKKP